MKLLEKSDATAPLSDFVGNSKSEPVIVTRNGKPIAAVLPITNADLETVSLSTNPEFLGLIERSRARMRAEGGISADEMRNRLGLGRSKPARPSRISSRNARKKRRP